MEYVANKITVEYRNMFGMNSTVSFEGVAEDTDEIIDWFINTALPGLGFNTTQHKEG